MKVLVTGSQGYIGTVLVPVLEERGHEVTGWDTGFFRDGVIGDPLDAPRLVRSGDTRDLTREDLEGFDAVCQLADLSNDPLGALDPDLTYRINHVSSARVARLARDAGVQRFVYMSSCSVYGAGNDSLRTEVSEVDPQTAYARCKILVERDVSGLASEGFSPTFLRNATAFGPSPRLRFDLVVNNLSGVAATTGVIQMTSDGTPWRPLVHVGDICEAIACVLAAPKDAVHNQAFNVGSTERNYRVREIAEIVARVFSDASTTFGQSDGDNRSYRVSFAKIQEHLPAFECRYGVEDGARQLKELFDRVGLTQEAFKSRHFTRLKQLQHLLETGQIDGDLRWVPVDAEAPALSRSRT